MSFIEENYSTHALNDNFLKYFAVREPVNLWMLQKTCVYSLPMPLNIVSIPLYFKNSPLLIQNWDQNLKQSLHRCPVSSFTSHILLQVDWGYATGALTSCSSLFILFASILCCNNLPVNDSMNEFHK